MDDVPAVGSRDPLPAIFAVFLKLGCTAFGGPVAHLAYFRDEFVARRRWLDEDGYADLVALCQFLPGPASSQVGFSLGILRGGGLLGGCAAWLGFTLPSAVFLSALAMGPFGTGHGPAQGLVHGLKLVAVAVVAQAVWGMARTLAPDRRRAAIALGAILIVVFAGPRVGQAAAIGLGAVAGLVLCRDGGAAASHAPPFPVTRRAGIAALVLLAALPVGAWWLAHGLHLAGAVLFEAFYRSGALVFGGGHVVLPLLRDAVVDPGWVALDRFLAGYGAAQAVPGPLFTFAAYLGAGSALAGGAAGAAIALAAVFLPGLLMVTGALPFWGRLRTWPAARSLVRGANAAVVGVLAAALYDPVWTGAVARPRDFALAVAGFLLLAVWKVAPWIVVVLVSGLGVLLSL